MGRGGFVMDHHSELDIRASLFKLAHFEPSCTDDYGNQLLDYLVLDALATYGPLIQVDPINIREHIQKNFFLDFDETEIASTGKRLYAKHYINLHYSQNKFDYPRFQILEQINSTIANNIKTIQEVEDEVIDEWKNQLLYDYSKYPQVEQNIEEIIHSFQVFLAHLFARHGIECVNLLYPVNPKTIEWLKSVQGGIFDNLPKINEFIDPILKYEIPRFFLSDDSKRKTYIFRTFNSSFLWHLVQVDDKCARLIKQVTKGQRLYLDNNVLYHLSGFDGGSIFRSSHSVLKFAKELGYDLFVTTKTIEEFHKSLNWRKKEINKKPPIPKELARLAVQYLTTGNFMSTYWNELAETGISIDEFIDEKSHIENILTGLGIKISDEFRNEIEASTELRDEISILRKVAPYSTGWNVIEHDAFHRVLINKIRDSKKYDFTDAIAWFLTSDSKLDAYDRVARKGEEYLPFCLTIDKWIQINRPFLTRTKNREEYESSFLVLVTQPYIRAMISSEAIEKSYQEVLSRLSRYQRMNPELALDIVIDRHFIASIKSDDDPAVNDKKLENKFLDLAEQYHKENDQLEAEKRKETQDKNTLKTENIELMDSLDSLNARIKQIEEQKTSEFSEIKDKNHQLTDALGISINQNKAKTDEISSLSTLIKWLVFTILLMPISYCIYNFINIDHYWINNLKELLLIKIATFLVSTSILLIIPLKKHWQFLIGACAVCFCGLIYTVLSR
jgi:hypothetical protein